MRRYAEKNRQDPCRTAHNLWRFYIRVVEPGRVKIRQEGPYTLAEVLAATEGAYSCRRCGCGWSKGSARE